MTTNKRIEMEKILKELKVLIAEVPKEKRQEVFGKEIKKLDSMADIFVGGNKILYKQIKKIMEMK